MQNFTTLIVDMVKKENLFASQGGNIILAQVCHVPLTPAQPGGGGRKSSSLSIQFA